MIIKPVIKNGGSAFRGNTTQAHRPMPFVKEVLLRKRRDYIKVVSLREWCDRNFISRDTGYKLIKFKYLVGFRRHGQWWVTANTDCMKQLLEYLDLEKLFFDVSQGSSG